MRRQRKEIEVARWIKGGIKRRETDSASNQFLKCFSAGEKVLLVDTPKEERAVKPVISLSSKNRY